MNCGSAGGKILGNGHLVSGAFIAYGEHSLYDALAVALYAYRHCSRAVPQGSCEDFGGTGAVFVDQDHKLNVHFAVFGFIFISVFLFIPVLQVAEFSLIHKQIRNIPGLVDPSAGIVPQVDDFSLCAL